MLPLILLIALSGFKCQTESLPDQPKPPLFQPIVEQNFCSPDGTVCEVKSLCREYRQATDGDYYLFTSHPLKKCHGILGVDSDMFIRIKQWLREMTEWIKDNCKVK